MSLGTILSEYEIKRNRKLVEAGNRKDMIINDYPDLKEIDDKISKKALEATRRLIEINDKSLLDDLNREIDDLKRQKEKLLKQYDINLEPDFDCKKCNDTGYIGNELCFCVKQKLINEQYRSSNIKNIENENFDNFDYELYSDKIENDKYKLSPRDNIKKIVEKSKEFIENFDDSDTKNLLFTGKTGLGKSFLSSCIANELLKKGKVVLYQTAPDMLDSIIDYRFGKDNAKEDILDTVQNVDLLIIDDLGTESINNMKMSELFQIINSRLINSDGRNLKTIISTNLNLNEIMNHYDERIFSRLVGNFDTYLFYGDDIRLLKK